MAAAEGRPGAARWVLPPLALAAWLLGVAVAGVGARYAPGHLAGLAAIWGLFALAIWAGAAFLRSLGRPGGVLAAFLLVLTAIWQLREQTFLPGSILAAVGLAALLAWPAWRLLLAPLGRGSWRRRLGTTAVTALAFAVVLLTAWRVSMVERWHLLRHNTFLGTPAWYLLEPPVAAVQAALFAAHEPLPAPPPGAASPAAATIIDKAGPEPPGLGELPATLPTAAGRPNLIFVLLDALRADALAAWGASEPMMPRLDEFLAGAWRFTDVWANASWTRPSMASFFTGLLPEEHGARGVDDALGEGFVTVAERLRDEGYATAAFVTNMAAVSESAGFAQGFDLYRELEGDPYARAEALGREVRRWLENTDGHGARPLFLYLHYLDPHEPYLAGEAPARKTAAEYLEAYRRELAYLDGELAELLPLLGERLAGETVFLFASDHGEEFFEHELFGHGLSLYQEVIHIPVALRWSTPGPGADLPQRLEARDFHSLLLAVARGEVGPADLPAWAAGNARRRRYASIYYSSTGRLVLRPYLRRVCMRALEEGDEKLIWSAYGDTYELYDLARDPGEHVNLAHRFPGRVAALAAGFDAEVAFWVQGAELTLSPAAREQMRALGYLD